MFVKNSVNTSFILAKVQDLALMRGAPRTPEDKEVGIEFEVEGDKLTTAFDVLNEKKPNLFLQKADGSLRGGFEYVFKGGLPRAAAKEAIKDFFDVFNSVATINNSDRCSTHMHLNFQHMTLLQVYLYLTVFYMLELPFFEKFAPERIGNAYCQPLFDCPAIGTNFAKNAKEGVLRYGNNNRYTSLNVTSLASHGTLECRMLGGSNEPTTPTTWMEILLELYDFVKNNPRMLPTEVLACDDIKSFVKTTFPKAWDHIKDVPNVEKLLQLGTFSVQDFVYSVDWTGAKTASAPERARRVDPSRVNVNSVYVDAFAEDNF